MGKWRTEVRKGREGQLGTCQTWAIDPLRSRAQAAQPDPAMPVPPSLCLRQMTRPGDAPSLLDTLGRRSDPIITSVIIRGTSIVSFNKHCTSCGPLTCGAGGWGGQCLYLLPSTPDSPTEAQRYRRYIWDCSSLELSAAGGGTESHSECPRLGCLQSTL